MKIRDLYEYTWPAMRNPTVLVYIEKEVGRSWLLQTFTNIHAQQEGSSKTPYLYIGLSSKCTTYSLPTGSPKVG
jgi:hypothetical protein